MGATFGRWLLSQIITPIILSLSADRTLTPAQRAIYITVMGRQPKSLSELAKILNVEYKTLKNHCFDLAAKGWLTLSKKGKCIIPRDTLPTAEEAKVAEFVRRTIEAMPYKGEAVAKAIVVWLVAANVPILFNVRPALLKNASTKQALEYDIFIPEWNWAGEYQGDQHYGTTDLFPSADEFVLRFQRDREKAILSRKHEIQLAVISKDELTPTRIDAKIPKEIPRRNYDPKGPVSKLLVQTGRSIASSKNYWDRD